MNKLLRLTQNAQFRPDRHKLFYLFASLILLYGILPELGRFQTTLTLIHRAHALWLGGALLLTFGTYVFASLIYITLAIKRLPFYRTFFIQLAGMFINRILPAGIGAIGVNYEYLKRNRHSSSQAAAVVSINNSLGFVGHGLILLSVLLLAKDTTSHLVLPHISRLVYLIGAIAIALVLVLLSWFQKFRKELFRFVLSLSRSVTAYRHRPIHLAIALLFSVGLTTMYAACLYACCRAFGLSLQPTQVFLVLTIGVAGGAVVPTPGGLGGAEAGLMAGLLAYHTTAPEALAVVLTYRLLTYWLPLLGGGPSFVVAEKQGYI